VVAAVLVAIFCDYAASELGSEAVYFSIALAWAGEYPFTSQSRTKFKFQRIRTEFGKRNQWIPSCNVFCKSVRTYSSERPVAATKPCLRTVGHGNSFLLMIKEIFFWWKAAQQLGLVGYSNNRRCLKKNLHFRITDFLFAA
jgi:hypothetical protein